MTTLRTARLAADIGGTFTDLALEVGDVRATLKVPTTGEAPEQAVLDGVSQLVAKVGLRPGDITQFIHGTTLATNALIERKGARTALVTTDGFRDSLEIGHEDRFDQYNIFIEKPKPLVPRNWRFTVVERIDARGQVRLPLDETSVAEVAGKLVDEGIESVAIGLLHSYVNPTHEERVRAILSSLLPQVDFTLSSDVCPEIREYERLSTACANAYVQPLMSGYLTRLERMMKDRGFVCPMFVMHSGGGQTTFDAAIRYPIRLVESGPAGGAILASHIAAECGIAQIVSFDMGGTTAKVCLLDDGMPQTSRLFEVAREYRFQKGSGLPLRIPVIELVEIGAGGGSIASVDEMKRVTVGPESATSNPGPACLGKGGTRPTVTDANLLLGRVDPERFAAGSIRLDRSKAEVALQQAVGDKLGLDVPLASFAVSEMVEENMANAARLHAIERGKDLTERTMVAFGGAAPLHAARLAEKLGVGHVVVPNGAGVGSAIGFLKAPIAFEQVKTHFSRLSAFNPKILNEMLAQMSRDALKMIHAQAEGMRLTERRTADMRFEGQGHEIVVPVPVRVLTDADAQSLRREFEACYMQMFNRIIPGLDIEITNWIVTLSTEPQAAQPATIPATSTSASALGYRSSFDPRTLAFGEVPVYARTALRPGDQIAGPALILEDETTTLVTDSFFVRVDTAHHLHLLSKPQP